MIASGRPGGDCAPRPERIRGMIASGLPAPPISVKYERGADPA